MLGRRQRATNAQKQRAPFDISHRFHTSWLLPPLVLAAIRALLSLYCFFAIVYSFAFRGSHGQTEANARSSSYFTNITYWSMAFYFAVSAAHTASYALTGTPLLARWPRVLQQLHSIFYSTIVVFPFLVTSGYPLSLFLLRSPSPSLAKS